MFYSIAGAMLFMSIMSLLYLNRERREMANIESRCDCYEFVYRSKKRRGGR